MQGTNGLQCTNISMNTIDNVMCVNTLEDWMHKASLSWSQFF